MFDIIIKSFMAVLNLCKSSASYRGQNIFFKVKINNQTLTNLNMPKINILVKYSEL